jgi:glycosyltransferase involved in cell wall biosynthesis
MTRLTIGVPAYRNAGTLRTSVESLLAQTFSDFRLVISDDNSPDETREVAMQLAREDSRIEYIRQPKNLKYQNFGFLLRQATTEFFMWAAGDDYWYPEFAERCIAELDAHPDIVLATSRVQFVQAGVAAGLSNATFPLLGAVDANIRSYLRTPGDNSRMYGVFRTAAGQRSFPEDSFHAYDWAFCAAILRFGGHAEIPEVLMARDLTPSANYQGLARADGNSALTRNFPLYAMSRWLLKEARIPRSGGVLGTLAALNINKHIEYIDHFHPLYARATQPLQTVWRRYIEWRLLK